MTTLKLDVTYFTRTPGFSPVQGVHSWNMSVTWVNRAMITIEIIVMMRVKMLWQSFQHFAVMKMMVNDGRCDDAGDRSDDDDVFVPFFKQIFVNEKGGYPLSPLMDSILSKT